MAAVVVCMGRIPSCMDCQPKSRGSWHRLLYDPVVYINVDRAPHYFFPGKDPASSWQRFFLSLRCPGSRISSSSVAGVRWRGEGRAACNNKEEEKKVLSFFSLDGLFESSGRGYSHCCVVVCEGSMATRHFAGITYRNACLYME